MDSILSALVWESGTTWHVYIDESRTPRDALRMHQHSDWLADPDLGRLGHANLTARSITIFAKGVPQEMIVLALAHELGHAHHLTNEPESDAWCNRCAESYARRYGRQLLDRVGIAYEDNRIVEDRSW